MSRPAKNTEVDPLIDPAIDQEKMTDAMQAMRQQAQEDAAELTDLARAIGAMQAFDLVGKFASASQVATFKVIRNSGRIKDLPIRTPDGRVATCDSMRDACPLLFGRSYDTMLREEDGYNLLGEQAYEAASRLGLSRSVLRMARTLPAEKLEVVRNAISSGSAKAEVLAVIEDLAEKVQKAEDTTAETKAEVAAKEKLLADKNQQIDSLRTELTLKKNLVIAPTDWPERFKGLMDQAQFAHKNIKLHISGLEAIREAALQTAPENPEDEASLDRARTVLADELVAIHRQCAEYLEALGLKFNKTLGSYASEGLWK